MTVLMLPEDRCTLYNSERVSHPSVVISPRWIFIAKTVHDQLDRFETLSLRWLLSLQNLKPSH